MLCLKRSILILTVLLAGFPLAVQAVPHLINYQGKVEVEGVPFTGTGLFGFALVNKTGQVQYWSHDGSNQRAFDVELEVTHGVFSVILGDVAIMNAIPAAVFDHEELYLRVLFSDEVHGLQMLQPFPQITSAAFAVRAETAADADTVDGMHYDSSWETTVGTIRDALHEDFHAIGGEDDDMPDDDSEVPNQLTIDNGSLFAANGGGNVGIGTHNPQRTLHVAGGILVQTMPEYSGNSQAISAGLPYGAFYRTGDVVKVVHPPSSATNTPTPSDTPTITPTPIPPGLLLSNDNIVGNMRYAPPSGPGGFTQGSYQGEPPEPCNDEYETPFTHILTRGLAVMETEVTRQMWNDLRTLQPSLPEDPSDTATSPDVGYPVQQNTWLEALLFANLLSAQNGYTSCYYTDSLFTTPITAANYLSGSYYCNFDADGYRLPTEGEWEHFCRAGTTEAFSCDEMNYAEGNCIDCTPGTFPVLQQHCVFCANSSGISAIAGSKDANPWNLKDVHGNILEWCWDWDGDYPTGTQTDYTGLSSGSFRSLRGGCFYLFALNSRSAARNHNYPDGRSEYAGFRLVRTMN